MLLVRFFFLVKLHGKVLFLWLNCLYYLLNFYKKVFRCSACIHMCDSIKSINNGNENDNDNKKGNDNDNINNDNSDDDDNNNNNNNNFNNNNNKLINDIANPSI